MDFDLLRSQLALTSWSKDRISAAKAIYEHCKTPEGCKSIVDDPALLDSIFTVARVRGEAQKYALSALSRMSKIQDLHQDLIAAEGFLACLASGLASTTTAHPAASALRNLCQSPDLRGIICRAEGILSGLADALYERGDAQHSAAVAVAYLTVNKELRPLLCEHADIADALAACASVNGCEGQVSAVGALLNLCSCKEGRRGMLISNNNKKKKKKRHGGDDDVDDEKAKPEEEEEEIEVDVENQQDAEEEENENVTTSNVLSGLVAAVFTGGKVRKSAIIALYKLSYDDNVAPILLQRKDVLAALGVAASIPSDSQKYAVRSLLELSCGITKDATVKVASETAAITGLATASASAPDDVSEIASRTLHVIAAEGGLALEQLRMAPGLLEQLAKAIKRGGSSWEDSARALSNAESYHHLNSPIGLDESLAGIISNWLVSAASNGNAIRKATARALAKLCDKILSVPMTPACLALGGGGGSDNSSSSSSNLVLGIRHVAASGDETAGKVLALLEKGRCQIRIFGMFSELSCVPYLTRCLKPSHLLHVDQGWKVLGKEEDSSMDVVSGHLSEFFKNSWDRTGEYWVVRDRFYEDMGVKAAEIVQIWKRERKVLSMYNAPSDCTLVIVAPCRHLSVKEEWMEALKKGEEEGGILGKIVVQLLVVGDDCIGSGVALKTWLSRQLDPAAAKKRKSENKVACVSLCFPSEGEGAKENWRSIGGGWANVVDEELCVKDGRKSEVKNVVEETEVKTAASTVVVAVAPTAADDDDDDDDDDGEEIVLEEESDGIVLKDPETTMAVTAATVAVNKEEEQEETGQEQELQAITNNDDGNEIVIDETAVEDEEDEPQQQQQPQLPWTMDNVGDANKKLVVEWIQANCPPDLLKTHKMNGNRDRVAKSRSKKEIIAAYAAVLEANKWTLK